MKFIVVDTKIENWQKYPDGFSFTVRTELEAYKAAYAYKHCKNTIVREAPNVNGWSVQVYTK